MVDRERLLRRFLEFCATDSASYRERALADRYRQVLAASGCRVGEDDTGVRIGGEAGNVIAHLPGTADRVPPLVLSVHLDRAPGGTGVRPQVRGGVVVAGGETVLGADDAAGLAAAAEAVQVLREQALPNPPLWVVATVAEEAGGLGARHLDLAPLRGAQVFVLDGEAPVGTVFTAGVGIARVVATFAGGAAAARTGRGRRRPGVGLRGVIPAGGGSSAPGGNGAGAGDGVSAILLAATAVAQLPQGTLDPATTGWVSWIAGGTAAGDRPDLCEIRGELRSHSAAGLDRWAAEWAERIRSAARAGGGRVAVSAEVVFAPYALPAQDPATHRALTAARACGLSARTSTARCGSDAHIWTARGLPAVLLGAGYRRSHTRRERMPVTELVRLAEWTLAIITAP